MRDKKIVSLGANMHLFTSFMYYLPTFYMTVYLIAVISCLLIKTKLSVLTVLVLSAMAYAGWDQTLWRNAESMAIFELFILSAMFFAFEGKFGTRLMVIVFLMIMSNVICIQFSFYESIRQSLISLLFFSACVITLKASYNTHKIRGYKKRVSHGNFWAREDGNLHVNKMVH